MSRSACGGCEGVGSHALPVSSTRRHASEADARAEHHRHALRAVLLRHGGAERAHQGRIKHRRQVQVAGPLGHFADMVCNAARPVLQPQRGNAESRIGWDIADVLSPDASHKRSSHIPAVLLKSSAATRREGRQTGPADSRRFEG
jgi:hypothetical protein